MGVSGGDGVRNIIPSLLGRNQSYGEADKVDERKKKRNFAKGGGPPREDVIKGINSSHKKGGGKSPRVLGRKTKRDGIRKKGPKPL